MHRQGGGGATHIILAVFPPITAPKLYSLLSSIPWSCCGRGTSKTGIPNFARANALLHMQEECQESTQ